MALAVCLGLTLPVGAGGELPAALRAPVSAPGLAAQPTPAPRVAAQQVVNTATPTPTLTTAERLALLDAQLTVAWNAQDWPAALGVIDQIVALDPNYDDIKNKHYQAHMNYGWELLTEGSCDASQAQFRAALQVNPDGREASDALGYVARYCPVVGPTSTPTMTPTPPTATPTPTSTGTITPQAPKEPFEYTVVAGDTLYSLAARYGTTVQAIMQLNGLMNADIRVGQKLMIPGTAAKPSGPLVHIVQPGETLYSLARRYNTTVWAIMTINNLTGTTIYPYRALFIPSPMTPGAIIHIVQVGETLNSIALRYKTSVAMLMLANNLSDYRLTVYQRLVIPPEGWQGYPPLPIWTGPGPSDCGHGYYTVRAGDTLYRIARANGISVNALMAANHLTSSLIVAGQRLCIP